MIEKATCKPTLHKHLFKDFLIILSAFSSAGTQEAAGLCDVILWSCCLGSKSLGLIIIKPQVCGHRGQRREDKGSFLLFSTIKAWELAFLISPFLPHPQTLNMDAISYQVL